MNITQQQLDCFLALVRSSFHFSRAAHDLCLSQPGVSRHLQTLEDQIGQALFIREGRVILALSPAGEELLGHALEIQGAWEKLKLRQGRLGVPAKEILRIATTHTQAVYRLPVPLAQFRELFPDVEIELLQASPAECVQLALSGKADLAIATEEIPKAAEMRLLPCYRWNRGYLVPAGHPLCAIPNPTLPDVCQFPLLSYNYGITGRSAMDEGFRRAGIQPSFALTAIDAEVIKVYVRAGFGVGIVAKMAYDPARETDLCMIDASDAFPHSTVWMGAPLDKALRPTALAFAKLFTPGIPESWHLQFELGQNPDWDLDLVPQA